MNELRPREPASAGGDYLRVEGWEAIRRGYLEYLHDESRMAAPRLEALHFPETAEQVAAAVRSARAAGHGVTVSGARTGITGAAVPLGAEEMICLERVKGRPVVRRAPGGRWVAHVRAGVTLDGLTDALDHGLCDYPDGKPERPLFYPVDSTETTAHLGGTIATNASGARTFHYGPTRQWVEWLRVVTADGRMLELRRCEARAEDGLLVWHGPGGERIDVHCPDLPIPSTKHTGGYHLGPDVDAVDLFVGSEGTLGIVVEAELRLAEKPSNRLFLVQFVADAQEAVALVGTLRGHEGLAPLAIEYIGPRAMDLLRSKGKQTPAYVEVSRLPGDAGAAVYIEIAFEDEPSLDAVYAALKDAVGAVGLEPAASWAGFTEPDAREMRRLRHAVPETVNAIIGQRKRDVPALHKVGTDMAVPPESLGEMMRFYERRLGECGLEFVIFGHIGDGHVHVNILPRDEAELARGEELYTEFAREAVRLRGSVAAEHGIGRIKKAFLPLQYSEVHLEAMRAVKRALDPEGVLNPGVLLDA